MMTTMAALLGALPLALGIGHRRGAAPAARHRDRRRPDRVPVLTLYTTPVVYLYLDRLRVAVRRRPSVATVHDRPGVAHRLGEP